MNNLLNDALRMLKGCVENMQENSQSFVIVIVIGLVISLALWFLAFRYTRLWNKKFRNNPIHYFLFTTAAIGTFLYIIIICSVSHLEEMANIAVDEWEKELKDDEYWSNSTFRKAYKAVLDLGEENLFNYSEQVKDGQIIPLTLPSSKAKCSEIYSEASYNNFQATRPFLSKIIWADASLPIGKITQSMEDFFEENDDKNYDLSKAIEIAAHYIKLELKRQAPRTVYLSRILLTLIFISLQLIAFGSVGIAAYRDLKIHT